MPEASPFLASIAEFSRVVLYNTPSEKLRCLQSLLVMLRSQAFESSQKDEIISMDDELPIIVYVTLMAEVENIYAEIQFVEDFITNDEALENEKKIITNIRVSLDYIAREWKL